MSRLDCNSCGARVEVPGDHVKPRIRCGQCGYYVDVPTNLRGRVEEPVVAAPAKSEKKKTAAPHLISGTTDDDDNPYTVPGDPVKKCTACFKEIDIDATFCVFCGVDFASGKKAKKAYEPIDRSWEPRWGYDLRLKVFLGCVLLNGVIAAITTAVGGGFGSAMTFILIQGGLQAFLLGSYDKLTVRRTGKGAATLLQTWRIAFIPRPPLKIDWKKSQGVGIIAIHQPGIFAWIIAIDLLFCGIVPGLLFYWYCIRPDRFHVSLCDVHGSTNDIVFRTTDREQADEICRTINDATGLWYKPVL